MAAARSATGSVEIPRLLVWGEITALTMDSPLHNVNTTTGTSRATTHFMSSTRVSFAGRSNRLLIEADMFASPHLRQNLFLTSKHPGTLYAFSGVRWPLSTVGRKIKIKIRTAKMIASCHGDPPWVT